MLFLVYNFCPNRIQGVPGILSGFVSLEREGPEEVMAAVSVDISFALCDTVIQLILASSTISVAKTG
jgi:hypothetical protein